MISRLATTLFALVTACAARADAGAAPATQQRAPLGAQERAMLESQVRATEIAFARTLADRDPEKFVAMIAPDVIWLADQPLHGPDEVLTRWRKYFEAATPPFSWRPEIVEVQDGGALALSTGPVMNPAGQRVGTYTSIWRREQSGEWKIIFDRGCPACDCAAAPGAAERKPQ